MNQDPTPAKIRIQKLTEYLRYDFTNEEFTEHARQLGRMNQELERAQEKKKSVSADLAAMVKNCEDAVSNQSRLVTNGYEYRNVECEVHFDTPEKGLKRITRLDTGEVVREVKMTGLELQEQLNFTESEEDDAEGEAPVDGKSAAAGDKQ